MAVVIPNRQQVTLRDALEVVPFFDWSRYIKLLGGKGNATDTKPRKIIKR